MSMDDSFLIPSPKGRCFKLKRFAWLAFHAAAIVLAVVLTMQPIFVVLAQPAQHYEVNELDRRISSIEGLNIDHRLTVIETLLNHLTITIEGRSVWSGVSMGGTGLLLAERLFAVLRRRKEI